MPATITPRASADDPDEYNDEVLEDGTPIVLDGSLGNGVLLQQTQRGENSGVNVTVESWTLFLPPTVDADSVAAITVDGDTYEFDGPPWSAYNPRLKRVTHIEATVKRVV